MQVMTLTIRKTATLWQLKQLYWLNPWIHEHDLTLKWITGRANTWGYINTWVNIIAPATRLVKQAKWCQLSFWGWYSTQRYFTIHKSLFGWREFWVISLNFLFSSSKSCGSHRTTLVWISFESRFSSLNDSVKWMSDQNWKQVSPVFKTQNQSLSGNIVNTCIFVGPASRTCVPQVLNINDFLFLSFPFLLLPATNQHFFINFLLLSLLSSLYFSPLHLKNNNTQAKISI